MELKKKKVDKPRVNVKEVDGGPRDILITKADELKEKLNISNMDSFMKSMFTLIAFFDSDASAENLESFVNGSIEEIASIAPKDCIENQLIQQLLITHHLFMKCSLKANIKEQYSSRVDEHIKNITKLSKLFIEQMKALSSYRNEGQQKVKVEHVYISEGGQAVFGNINPSKNRGGGKK